MSEKNLCKKVCIYACMACKMETVPASARTNITVYTGIKKLKEEKLNPNVSRNNVLKTEKRKHNILKGKKGQFTR